MKTNRFRHAQALAAVLALGGALLMTHPTAHALSGESYDELPPNVGTWTSARFEGKKLVSFRYNKRVLPYSGQVVHSVKAVSNDKSLAKFDRFLGVVFDKDGVEQLDRGQALRQAEKKAKYALFGAIRPELAQKLLTAGANEPIPVAIWLNTHMPHVDREVLVASPEAAAAYKAEVAAIHAAARQRLMVNWKTLTGAPIVFTENSPLALAHLTPNAIYAIAKHPAVARIYYDTAPEHTTSTNWDQAVNATSTGKDGTGFEVCILEGAKPNTSGETMAGVPSTNAYNCSGGDSSVAARWHAEIVASSSSPYGVADGALTPFGNWEGTSCSGQTQGKAIDWCSDTREADAWSWPYTCPSGIDALLDFHAKMAPFATIAVSADNLGSSYATSCQGYNVINVGASDHKNTVSRSDDVLWTSTSSSNPATDWELPMLCAPGKDIETGSGTFADGTSPATTMVAAAATQILHKNSNLNSWNEGVRAILMCAADENVDGPILDLGDAVDDKDGAGELNVDLGVEIAASANKVDEDNTARATGHDHQTMSASDFEVEGSRYILNKNKPYRAKTTERGLYLRVVLVWDGTATCTANDDPSTCGSTVVDGDFDLWIWDPDTNGGEWIKSLMADGSYEFKQFAATKDTTYEIYVDRWSWEPGVSSTFMGLAWHFAEYQN